MSAKQWPTWSVSYNIDGGRWSIFIVAVDKEDAMRRLKQAATWGEIDGEIHAAVRAKRGGFLIPLACWWQNLWLKRKL